MAFTTPQKCSRCKQADWCTDKPQCPNPNPKPKKEEKDNG